MNSREVGQKLRAYRMESGLKAEDISERLGISRAALYRYEKGEVIKLETLTRLAELLQTSPLTLMGIGAEYFDAPARFIERVRQIEETSDQILQFLGPLCYLLTSERFDETLSRIFEEHLAATATDQQTAQAQAQELMDLMLARKKSYLARKPTVIAILTTTSIQQFLENGLAPLAQISNATRGLARKTAREEIEKIASLMESEPLGLQLGLMPKSEANGAFTLFRPRDRATLAINPFASDSLPNASTGVAMITSADDAVAAHQRAFEQAWPASLKGVAAASLARGLIMETRP